ALTPGSIDLDPLADTYVEQDMATTNSGAAQTVLVDAAVVSGTTNAVADGYLKFDLTSLGGLPISQALLRMYVTNMSVGVININNVTNTTWEETGTNGITWNTRPAMGSTITSLTPSTQGVWIEVDITSTVA